MRNRSGVFPLMLAFATLAAPAVTQAQSIVIRSNEVIPVRFENDINLNKNKRGDRFEATVRDDRDLPRGTRFIGRVERIERKRDDRPGYAELRFYEIETPDGRRTSIRALPLEINDRTVNRRRDGRFEAKKGTRTENVVLGGVAGGLILGALLDKPFEGAMIGAIAGIVLAETNALNTNGDIVIKKGQEMGAMFEREARINYDGRYDRYDDRNDGRYDDQYDDRYGDRYERDRIERDRIERDRYERDRREDDRYYSGARIVYQDRDLRFNRDAEPYREGTTMMVPLLETARQLNLEVGRIENDRFYVENEDFSLRLEQGSRDYRLNGRRGTMPRAVTERDGVVYIPLEVLAEMTRDAIYVNGTRVRKSA